MRSRQLPLILATALAGFAAMAQPALVCPTAPAGRPCDVYHFHVQMYRVDTKQFIELFGLNQFASQAACDRAREIHIASNKRAVDYLRSIKKVVETDRVGPCHCDMTGDKAAPNHLAPEQRQQHLRTAEEIRLRLREKLLDEKLTNDSEVVRGLWTDAPGTPQLGAPKFVSLPSGGAPAPFLTAPEDLRATKTIDGSKPVLVGLDVPLVEVGAPAPPAPAAVDTRPQSADSETGGAGVAETPASPAQPRTDPAQEEVVVQMPPAPAETDAEPAVETTTNAPDEDFLSAQETAARFVSVESERIQNVLRASAAIADETVKSKIFSACMQRSAVLSNLRLLIEGAGMRSRLATATRDAHDEAGRLELIGRLFGEDMKPHWAPKDAADVIFEVDPAIAAEPERALRDTTGAVSTDQKKRALYLVLAQSEPTEDTLLWLGTIVEGFLR